MKTYKNMFNKMISPQMVAYCALDAAKGKIQRKEIMQAFIDFDETYRKVIESACDTSFKPCEDNVREIIDGVHNKKRVIEKPHFCPEQILHHMIIEPFKPVLLNGLYEHVYGCLPANTVNRNGKPFVRKYGPHEAVKRLVKWTKEKHCKIYVCETDVHHAYGSVDVDILLNKMGKVIKDNEWLRLTKNFLYHSKDQGLVLGHYTSPWFFNFYLKEFDHFAARQGVKYLRYADNIFLVGNNKRKIHKALDNIRKYLMDNLKLTLNASTQIYRFEHIDKDGKVKGRAINALGMIVHYNRVTLRKSILKSMRRKAFRLHKKPVLSWHDCASMMARMSYIRHTNTYTYYLKYIKPYINTRQMKRKLRKHSREIAPLSKERRLIVYEGLEKSNELRKTGGI